jgi:hypothetical protein
MSEALDHPVLHLGQKTDVLGQPTEPLSARSADDTFQSSSVLGRQCEPQGCGVVADDAPSRHRCQPFPDVAFVQAGGRCYIGGIGRWQLLHNVEERGAVTHTDHQGEHRAVDNIY